jgi:hypothetical protein
MVVRDAERVACGVSPTPAEQKFARNVLHALYGVVSKEEPGRPVGQPFDHPVGNGLAIQDWNVPVFAMIEAALPKENEVSAVGGATFADGLALV